MRVIVTGYFVHQLNDVTQSISFLFRLVRQINNILSDDCLSKSETIKTAVTEENNNLLFVNLKLYIYLSFAIMNKEFTETNAHPWHELLRLIFSDDYCIRILNYGNAYTEIPIVCIAFWHQSSKHALLEYSHESDVFWIITSVQLYRTLCTHHHFLSICAKYFFLSPKPKSFPVYPQKRFTRFFSRSLALIKKK